MRSRSSDVPARAKGKPSRYTTAPLHRRGPAAPKTRWSGASGAAPLHDAFERACPSRLPPLRAPGRRGRREVPADGEFLVWIDACRRARPLPLLRGGHHVLASSRSSSSWAAGPRPRAAAAIASLLGESRRARLPKRSSGRFASCSSRPAPVVCVFDDLHWAEPTFLDLVDHIADWSRDAPILLVCVARPELLDGGRAGPAASSTRRRCCSSRCPRTMPTLIELLLGPRLDESMRARILERGGEPALR